MNPTTPLSPIKDNRQPLQGRVSFSGKPSDAQYRFLVYCLAHHPATATAFERLEVPIHYLFGSVATDAVTLRAAACELGYKFPCLSINETNPRTGRLVRQGSYCFLTVFTHLDHSEGSPFVAGALNNRLLDYLPQVIKLLPAELLEALPLASKTLQLAA